MPAVHWSAAPLRCRHLTSTAPPLLTFATPQINEKPEKPAAAGKAGQDNAGFDGEKGGKKEKWADNYIPYGQFPKGTSVEEVRIENEKENKSVEKVLKEDEKWKEAYVPFEGENKEEEKEKE